VLVALNGTILWLFSSCGGGTNNLELALLEWEQMGNQFEPDEPGVADAGFHGASSISLFLSSI